MLVQGNCTDLFKELTDDEIDFIETAPCKPTHLKGFAPFNNLWSGRTIKRIYQKKGRDSLWIFANQFIVFCCSLTKIS